LRSCSISHGAGADCQQNIFHTFDRTKFGAASGNGEGSLPFLADAPGGKPDVI